MAKCEIQCGKNMPACCRAQLDSGKTTSEATCQTPSIVAKPEEVAEKTKAKTASFSREDIMEFLQDACAL